MTGHWGSDRYLTEHQGGYTQKEINEMETILKEMGPGGKYHHAHPHDGVLSDKQIVAHGVKTGHSTNAHFHSDVPSFYHGKWRAAGHGDSLRGSMHELSMPARVALLAAVVALLVLGGFAGVKIFKKLRKSKKR